MHLPLSMSLVSGEKEKYLKCVTIQLALKVIQNTNVNAFVTSFVYVEKVQQSICLTIHIAPKIIEDTNVIAFVIRYLPELLSQ